MHTNRTAIRGKEYLTTFRKNKMLEKETFIFLPFLFPKKMSPIYGNIKLFLWSPSMVTFYEYSRMAINCCLNF